MVLSRQVGGVKKLLGIVLEGAAEDGGFKVLEDDFIGGHGMAAVGPCCTV